MTTKKTTYCLPILLFMLVLISSCKKDEGVSGNYAASYSAWKSFKSSVNNSYQYAVITDSWTGHATETILTVKNGKVVQRAYVGKVIDGQFGTVKITEQWTEDASTLNVHQQQGAETITLDEVYTKAKSQWLINSKNTETYFETNNQGMISTAGYTDKNCMDDCFTGIKISFIRKTTTDL